jgi:hypothetical protein
MLIKISHGLSSSDPSSLLSLAGSFADHMLRDKVRVVPHALGSCVELSECGRTVDLISAVCRELDSTQPYNPMLGGVRMPGVIHGHNRDVVVRFGLVLQVSLKPTEDENSHSKYAGFN